LDAAADRDVYNDATRSADDPSWGNDRKNRDAEANIARLLLERELRDLGVNEVVITGVITRLSWRLSWQNSSALRQPESPLRLDVPSGNSGKPVRQRNRGV
jgi:hypothetical protein